MSRIITIGREFGSGGRELGCRLAESLGFAYYDQEIITEIANRTELSEKYVQQILEVDKHRARYYTFYTEQKWGDRRNYDMCINTTYADVKKVASAMVKFFSIED